MPLHVLHVAGASVWLPGILLQIAMHGVDTPVKLSLLLFGILWRFLDVVWIGIVSPGGLAWARRRRTRPPRAPRRAARSCDAM